MNQRQVMNAMRDQTEVELSEKIRNRARVGKNVRWNIAAVRYRHHTFGPPCPRLEVLLVNRLHVPVYVLASELRICE